MTDISAFEMKVGHIFKDMFVTYRRYPMHFFRKGQGYPISVSALEMLQQQGVTKIKIIEKREGELAEHEYICDLQLYLNGSPVHEEHNDEQMVVPLELMERIN